MKVTYHDIEAVDPDYYKNLKWLLEVNTFKDMVNIILLWFLNFKFNTLFVISE